MTNIVSYIKVKRLVWAGHLMCMNKDRTIKKFLTPNRVEKEELEDLNSDGKVVLIKI
jgi:hypothetical protein